jgi:hypothetical protein
LYPIELGYDVSERRLHPSFGDWSLIAKTGDITASDYDMNDAIKNGGAGNAYKTVETKGYGVLLFQYTSTNALSCVEVGKKFWVYVCVLPNMKGVVSALDTFICVTKPTTSIPHPVYDVKFNDLFKDVLDLYNGAKFSYKWASNDKEVRDTESIPTDSVAKYNLFDTLVISNTPDGYSCGDTIFFKYDIVVDTLARDTLGKSYVICPSDTLGTHSPNEWFKRNLPGGKYTPATVAPWNKATTKPWVVKGETLGTFNVFKYDYNKCSGTPGKTIEDTLFLLTKELPDDSIGADTVIYCRENSSVPIFDVYDKAHYAIQPLLTETNSFWEELGILVGKSTKDYGTTDSTASLTNYSLNFDIMRSSIVYNYKWSTTIECFIDKQGNPGFGLLSVYIQDPVAAQDYTAQLCKDSYTAGSGTNFNMNTYTGLDVVWTKKDGSTMASNGIITPTGMTLGTHPYYYNLPADCSVGGKEKGVFYIKITSKVKVPKAKTVRYCVDKLPATINMNDVLGVAVNGLTWVSPWAATEDAAYGFDRSSGTLTISKYIANRAAKNLTPKENLVFKTTGASTCGVSNDIELTISIGSL